MNFCTDYVVVLFRVVTVYPDLKPYMEDVNVSISVSVFIHEILLHGQFLPRDALLSAVYAVVVCLCVCVSVCLSVCVSVCVSVTLRLYQNG